jgi:uncharacterized protein involved in exopolysaccharide biosynthesis
MNSVNLSEQEETGSSIPKVDLSIILTSLQNRKLIIISITLIASLVFFFLSKIIIKDKWEVRAIIINHPKNMVQQTIPYLYQQMNANTIIETIKLRRNLVEVVKRLHLDMIPEQLHKKIRVYKERKSNIFHLFIQDKDPKMAVDIANTLAWVFINSFAPIQNNSAQKIYKYYIEQKNKILKERIKLEKESEEFKKKKKLISIESETRLRFDKLKEVELSFVEIKMLITELQTKIEDNNKEITLLPDNVPLTQAVKSSYLRNIKEAKENLRRLQKKYTENNPKIKKLLEEIKNLEKQSELNLKKKKGPFKPDEVIYGINTLKQSLVLETIRMEAELKASIKKEINYNKQISEIMKELSYLSKTEKEYFSIKRRIDLNKEMLIKIETRIMDTKIAMESNINDFEILEPAVLPKYPLSSGRKVLIIFGGGFFFFLTIFILAIKEVLNFSVKSELDFRDNLNIELIGNIPDKDDVKDTLFYSAFQILYKTILNKINKDSFSFITIGSSHSKSGKTFIINEIVEFLTAEEKRILHIETVNNIDKIKSNSIINEFLYKVKDVPHPDKKIISDNYHKLYFFAENNLLKRVIRRENIKKFLELNSEYDFIIWEVCDFSFSIQLVLDIAVFSDLFLIIAEFKKTKLLPLKKAVNFLKKGGIKKIAGVLNRVEKKYFHDRF